MGAPAPLVDLAENMFQPTPPVILSRAILIKIREPSRLSKAIDAAIQRARPLEKPGYILLKNARRPNGFTSARSLS